MLLAGDVGGTKTHLGLFRLEGTTPVMVEEKTFRSSDYTHLSDVVKAFLNGRDVEIEQGTLGVAGPVVDGVVEATNLPWEANAAHLTADIGQGKIDLINDLVANAIGIRMLRPEQMAELNRGNPDIDGNKALISAGTGLGQAGLFWDGRRHRPLASEGGHADFAPRTSIEVELFQYLHIRFPHVSYERVLSGAGLVNVYHFFVYRTRTDDRLQQLMDDLKISDPAAAISHAALTERDSMCTLALDLFVSLYGAAAGNLALNLLATGGVYIGGGIAPKIMLALRRPNFLSAFLDKGRLRSLLEDIPIHVILEDKTALLGAARHAADELLDRG